MMQKSSTVINIENFIKKEVKVLFLIVSIVSFVFFKNIYGIIVLAVSSLVGFIRFCCIDELLSEFLKKRGKVSKKKVQCIFNYLLSCIVTAVGLIVALRLGKCVFVLSVIGTIFTSVIIVFNGITEVLGITHNKFEQREGD